MNRFRGVLYILILSLLVTTAYGFSIREFLGLDDENQVKSEDEPEKEVIESEQQIGKDKNDNGRIKLSLDYDEIEGVISLLNEEQKKQILSDKEAFTKLVNQQSSNKSVLSAALANNIQKNDKTVFVLQRNAENLLREIYLNKLIASKIPEDFPSEKQIVKYYEDNKEKFVLAQRMHVWQIFLPITEDNNTTKDIEILKKKVESIKKDLEKGELDFAVAANRYSGHEGSLTTGGYMGLVEVDNLKPEFKQPLLDLQEGKISQPIKTDEGIHLLKRGAMVPEQDVSLDQIRDQIEKLLKKQLNIKLRQLAYEQAEKTYPVNIDEKTIEEWRLRLRTNP